MGVSTSAYAIAHRGLCELHVENSLVAFEAALAHTDVLEVDIRATSDAVLVCTHDATLERLHGRATRIGQLTWSELHAAAPDIPRLADVLDAFGQRAGWFLDCKVSRPRAIEALERTLREHDISLETGSYLRTGQPLPSGSACFESVNGELLQGFRARTGAGCAELVRGESSARELALTASFITTYAQGVVLPKKLATRRMLRLLRTLRLGIYVYTVNDQDRFAQLAAHGASGVFTDAVHRVG